MSLSIYIKDVNGPGANIQVACESLVPQEELTVLSSIEELSQWLMKTHYQDAVIVLIAQDPDELSELVPILPLFRKLKIVTMLPDREPETIKIGYKLEPRFLGFLDSGLSSLKEIVNTMLKRPKTAEKTPEFREKIAK